MNAKFLFFALLLATTLLTSCSNKTVDGHLVGDYSCLENTDTRKGVATGKPGMHFSMEFPPNYVIDASFERGLTASDTLGDVESYNLVVVSEFQLQGVDFDIQFAGVKQWIEENPKLTILASGQTTLGGYPCEWLLLEDHEITREIGMHYRINYIFPIPNTDYFYVVNNETYGANRWEDLCFLKEVTNTFTFTR